MNDPNSFVYMYKIHHFIQLPIYSSMVFELIVEIAEFAEAFYNEVLVIKKRITKEKQHLWQKIWLRMENILQGVNFQAALGDLMQCFRYFPQSEAVFFF